MTSVRVRENTISVSLTHGGIKKAVKSYTMSKRYINTMLRATIINILYHRVNIDEKEFITKVFNNIPFKTFRTKSKNILIREFHTYMAACKDALDKNYLKEFYLYFVDTTTGDIVENYKFFFQYANKNNQNHSQSEDNLTDSTCELLQTLEDLGKHKRFNSEIQIKVEFTYFDDTPEEYEPPGFRGIEESESLVKKINKSGNSIVIGTLFTGFHRLKCRGRGNVFNFNHSPTPNSIESNIDEIININAMEKTTKLAATAEMHSVTGSHLLTVDLSEDVDGSDVTKSVQEFPTKFNDTYISQRIDISSDGEESNFACPCKLPDFNLKVDKIECVICKRLYHAPCQGYIDRNFLKPPFRCMQCSDENDTENVVSSIDSKPSMPLCRIRFILACIYQNSSVPSELESVFQDTMENLKKQDLFIVNGDNKLKVSSNVLHALFKFDQKSPDMNKLANVNDNNKSNEI